MHRAGRGARMPLSLLATGLLATTALALPETAGATVIEEEFELINAVAPCPVRAPRTCVKTDASASYKSDFSETQIFDVEYLLGGDDPMPDGDPNTVTWRLPDFFLPSIIGPGFMDAFTITTDVIGEMDTATGEANLTFDMFVTRNGLASPLFTYTLTTGDASAPACGGATASTLSGVPHDASDNSMTLIGNQCVNFASSGAPDLRLLQVALTGSIPLPQIVPEPGTLLLVGPGLLGLAFASRRRR